MIHFVVFLLVALAIVGAILVLTVFFGKREPGAVKDDTYECGMVPFHSARVKFPLRFAVIALLFILFDIEVTFIYPWAVLFRELGAFALVEMGVFLLVLLFGLVYVWKRGGLEWE